MIRRIMLTTALLAATAALLGGCAAMSQSAYYPSEFRAGVAQSYDEEERHAKYTTLSVEFRWPLKPAPVRDVSRPIPPPTPPRYAEPPCAQPLPE